MYTLTATVTKVIDTVEEVQELDWEVPTDAFCDYSSRDQMGGTWDQWYNYCQLQLQIALKDFQGYNDVILQDDALDYFIDAAEEFYNMK